MNTLIILSAVFAVAFARPGVLLSHQVATLGAPLAYASIVPGAPIGHDGRVVDTPEVAVAKAEHAVAHVNEKINLANEAVKSADVITYGSPVLASGVHAVASPVHTVASGLHTVASGLHTVASPVHSVVRSVHPVATAIHPVASAVHPVAYTNLVHAAPVGHDGRVVDTAEVAIAKAEHAAAHINEKLGHIAEAQKSVELPYVVSSYSAPLIQTHAW